MSYESVLSTVTRKWASLVLSGLLFGAIAFFSLVFLSRHFKVSTDFLVVQTGMGQSQDFYAMLKSSEYLGKVLSESVGSEKFIAAVVETGGVDGNFLPSNPKDRLKEWEKTVKVSNNPDVGSLHIEVFADSDRGGLRVAQAVGKVLTEKNSLFRSGDEKSVEIRTLSGPIVEKNPSIERLALAGIAGSIFGMTMFLLFSLLREEARLRKDQLLDEVLARRIAKEAESSKTVRHLTASETEKSNLETIYSESHLVFDK